VIAAQIQNLLRSGDSFAVAEWIQYEGTCQAIAARYQGAVSELYWKARDLPAVVTVGRAGILYCLGRAAEGEISPENTEVLRGVAKGLAYDVGSFTWPGWEEPGISPSEAELATGRDCAALNLRLAIELKKPADRVSMAHWLVGAHALAKGDWDSAIAAFTRALDVFGPGDPAAVAMRPCNAGYLAVAQLCRNSGDVEALGQFETVTASLKAREDADAKVYLAQLLAARRLFVAGSR
jgi:hypothetical protein